MRAADDTTEDGGRTETGPGGIPFTDGTPHGPFGAALSRAETRRLARRRRAESPLDFVGAQAAAVVLAWLSAVDYEPPIFLAAWEQPGKTLFLLTGFVPPTRSLRSPVIDESTGYKIAFSYEGGWEDTPRGFERKVSATVTGLGSVHLRPSRFAQADGVLVPVGYSTRGVLHLPLLGPAISVSGPGPGALDMVSAMMLRARVRLGSGAFRAVVAESIRELFGVTGDVETFPASLTEAEDVHRALLMETMGRQDWFSDKLAANFREHALIRHGAHVPVMVLGFDRRASNAPVYALDGERGIVTIVIGECDQAGRHIAVSDLRADIDAAVGLPPIRLRRTSVSRAELERTALQLHANAEPDEADGLPATVERSGFVANPRPVESSTEIRLSIPTPLRPVGDETRLETVPEPAEQQAAEARRIYGLGRLRVEIGGDVVEGRFRAKSRELLALLISNPDGIVKKKAQEILWPEAEPDKGDDNFRQCRSNIRKHLGVADDGSDIVERVDDLVRLNLKLVWVDVVAFQKALTRAKKADDPEADLREAVDLYGGDFCEGVYDWSETDCQRLRLDFIDAAFDLSAILGTRGEIDEALRVLDKAIAADHYAEHLYRRAMELESKRGRGDAVVRRYRRLEKLLADELDVAPQDKTVEVFRALTDS